MSEYKKRSINTKGGKLRKMNVPFTQIANSVLNDKTLSLRAKGLFAYMYSKPHGWEFSSYRMVNESTEGRDAIRTAEKELIIAGYLVRKKLNTGKLQVHLSYKRSNTKD
jgi:hypothetical protein